ncbi:MAG: protein phosphatase CheZ [Deltaproteobacteria bacterium]|nr:protein phosphatase CheZ [Deltaproteobacteria bacterium]
MKFANEKTMDELARQIGQYVAETLEPTFRVTLETEIGKALDRAINEGRFYRYMSEEFQEGMTGLFKEISNFKKTTVQTEPSCLPDTQEKAEKMLSEASTQLDYIFKSTEEAATKILDIIEKNMGVQERTLALLEKEGAKVSNNGFVDELKAINREIQNDYVEIMTTLSFQDLTGQRIKKVVGFLSFIENEVLRLLISTGMKIKEKATYPDKDAAQIISEAEAMADITLKGPQDGTSQADIDKLLSDLGL